MAAKGGPPVRIAMVHSFYSSAQPSGENTVVLNEVDALRRAGHEVALFAAHTDELEGELFYKLRAGMRVATGYGRNPLKAIEEFSPDVVHVHNLFPNLGNRWVGDLDAPLVATLHNYRPLCANGLLFRDGAVCTRCPDGDRLAGLRFGCYRDSYSATLPISVANYQGPTKDPLLTRADVLVALSPLQKAVYRSAGVPDEALEVAPNFLPDSLDAGELLPAEPPRFIAVGRLAAEKGYAELIRNWPRGFPLDILGSGPRSDSLRRIGHPDVTVLARVPRAVAIHRVGLATAFIFPSLCLEASPLTCIEALSVGTPILASSGNSTERMITELGGGLVVEPHEWKPAILAITSDCRVRKSTRRVFEENFSEGVFVRRRTKLYVRLLETYTVRPERTA